MHITTAISLLLTTTTAVALTSWYFLWFDSTRKSKKHIFPMIKLLISGWKIIITIGWGRVVDGIGVGNDGGGDCSTSSQTTTSTTSTTSMDLESPNNLKSLLEEVRCSERKNFIKISFSLPTFASFFKISIKHISIFTSLSNITFKSRPSKTPIKSSTEKKTPFLHFFKRFQPNLVIYDIDVICASPTYSKNPSLQGTATNLLSFGITNFDTENGIFNICLKEIILECPVSSGDCHIAKTEVLFSSSVHRSDWSFLVDDPTITVNLTTLLLLKQLFHGITGGSSGGGFGSSSFSDSSVNNTTTTNNTCIRSKKPFVLQIILPESEEHPTIFRSAIISSSEEMNFSIGNGGGSFSTKNTISIQAAMQPDPPSPTTTTPSLISILKIEGFNLFLKDNYSDSDSNNDNDNDGYRKILHSLLPTLKYININNQKQIQQKEIQIEIQSLSFEVPFKFQLYNLVDHLTYMVKAVKKKEFTPRKEDYRQEFLPYTQDHNWSIKLRVVGRVEFVILDEALQSLLIGQQMFLEKRSEIQEEYARRSRNVENEDGNETNRLKTLSDGILCCFRKHLFSSGRYPLLGVFGSKVDLSFTYDGSWMRHFDFQSVNDDFGGGFGGDDDFTTTKTEKYQKGMMTLLNAIEGGGSFSTEGIEALSLLFGGYTDLTIEDFSLQIRNSLLVETAKIQANGMLFFIEEGLKASLMQNDDFIDTDNIDIFNDSNNGNDNKTNNDKTKNNNNNQSIQTTKVDLFKLPLDNLFHLCNGESSITCHRTTSPIKIFHSLHVQIPHSLLVRLNPAVEASLLEIDDCFDLFSRPSTIMLPWWDKLRLMFHGSIGSLEVGDRISLQVGRAGGGGGGEEELFLTISKGLSMGGTSGVLDLRGGVCIWGRSSKMPDYLEPYMGEMNIFEKDFKDFFNVDCVNDNNDNNDDDESQSQKKKKKKKHPFFPLFSLPDIRCKPSVVILGQKNKVPISHSSIGDAPSDAEDPYKLFKSHSISLSLKVESKSADKLSWYYGEPSNRFIKRVLFSEDLKRKPKAKGGGKTLSSVFDELHLSLLYDGTFTIRNIMFPTTPSSLEKEEDGGGCSKTTMIGTILRSTGCSVINLCWKASSSSKFVLLYKEYSFSSLSINFFKGNNGCVGGTNTNTNTNASSGNDLYLKKVPKAPLQEELLYYLGFPSDEGVSGGGKVEILEFITAPNAYWIGADVYSGGCDAHKGCAAGGNGATDSTATTDNTATTEKDSNNECLKAFIERRTLELEEEIVFLSHSLSLIDPSDDKGDFVVIKRELSVLLQKQRSLKFLIPDCCSVASNCSNGDFNSKNNISINSKNSKNNVNDASFTVPNNQTNTIEHQNSSEVGEVLVYGSRLLWHQTNRDLLFLIFKEWEEEAERSSLSGEGMKSFLKRILKEVSTAAGGGPGCGAGDDIPTATSMPTSPINHSPSGLDSLLFDTASSECIVAVSEDSSGSGFSGAGSGAESGEYLHESDVLPQQQQQQPTPLPFLKAAQFTSLLLNKNLFSENNNKHLRGSLFSVLIKDCQFVLLDQETVSTSFLVLTSPLVQVEHSSYLRWRRMEEHHHPYDANEHRQQQPQKIASRSISTIKDVRLLRKQLLPTDDSVPWYPLDSSERLCLPNFSEFKELSAGFDLEISFTTTNNSFGGGCGFDGCGGCNGCGCGVKIIPSIIQTIPSITQTQTTIQTQTTTAQTLFPQGSNVNFRLPKRNDKISFRLQKEAFHDLFSTISNLLLTRDPSVEDRRVQQEEGLVLGRYLQSTMPMHRSLSTDIIQTFTALQSGIRECKRKGTCNRSLEEEGRVLLRTLSSIPLKATKRMASASSSMLKIILDLPVLVVTLEPEIAQLRLVDLHLEIQKKDSMQDLMFDVVGFEIDNLMEADGCGICSVCSGGVADGSSGGVGCVNDCKSLSPSLSSFRKLITRLPLDEQLRRGMSLQRGWTGTLSRLKRGLVNGDATTTTSTTSSSTTSTATTSTTKHEQMSLSFNLRDLGKVGGIKVVEQLELTMSPLHINITREIVDELVTFFFPSDKEATPVSRKKSLLGLGGGGSFLRRTDSIKDHSSVIGEVCSRRERGAKYSSFIYVMIPTTQHLISYRSGKAKKTAMMDLDHFRVQMPKFEYHSKIWSWFEFWQQIKKDSLGAIANNIGHLMKDKLFSSPNTVAKSKLGIHSVNDVCADGDDGDDGDDVDNVSIIIGGEDADKKRENDLKEKRRKRASLLLGEYYN